MMFPLHIGLDPVIVQLGPVALRWYGLMIGIGIAVGLMLSAREADRTGIGRETIYSLATWLIIFGIIGGRLYYVVQNDFGYYLTHPQDILATWQGGMAFFGTIFASIIVVSVFCYRHRLPVLLLLDTLTPGLPLGQAFGRIGNVVNGDIVGYQTTSPFAFIYTNPHSFIDPALLNKPVVPASLIELFTSLLIFGMLWAVRKRMRIHGLLAVLYIFAYSLSQVIVFFWRANSITLFDLKQAQLTGLVVMAACIPVAVYLYYRSQRQPATDGTTTVPARPEPVAAGDASPTEELPSAS